MKKFLIAAIALTLFWSCVAARATDVVKRVQFAPGASSANIIGVVDVSKKKDRFGVGTDRYTIGARAGQRLNIGGFSDTPAIVYMWRGDYNKGMVLSKQGSDIHAEVTLPATGDYTLEVSPGPGVNKAQYRYTVTIH